MKKKIDKDEIYKKWEESGMLDDFKTLNENQEKHILNESATQSTSSFDTIAFPIVRKVAAQTIGMGNGVTEDDQRKVIEENRQGKIDKILYGKEFEEKEVPEIDHGIIPVSPLPSPKCDLMYLDFKYEGINGTSSVSETKNDK